MPARKEGKTWSADFYYTDSLGVRKRKHKRGFETKKAALEWERQFLMQSGGDMEMDFESYAEVYLEDVKPSLKNSTWQHKQYYINGSFSGSQFQLGDHNSQYVNTTDYSELLSELKQQVESIKMSANQTEELNSLIEKAQELSKGNDIGGVRKVLSEIWDVVKQIGIPILTTYVSMKFGLR